MLREAWPEVRLQGFRALHGPAAIGAIAGSALPLSLGLRHIWQLGALALAAIWLLGFRKRMIAALVGSGVLGAIAALAGAPVSR
jgi:chromate transporter